MEFACFRDRPAAAVTRDADCVISLPRDVVQRTSRNGKLLFCTLEWTEFVCLS